MLIHMTLGIAMQRKIQKKFYEPGEVGVGDGANFKFCACGYLYSAAITITGDIYVFGSHEKGRLGIGLVDEKGKETFPVKVTAKNFPRMAYISCGDNHVLAIPDYDSESKDGDKGIWSWGLGKNGVLGHGNEENLFSPKLIEKLIDKEFDKVCCGEHHSLALSKAGEIYFWGAKQHCIGAEGADEEDRKDPVLMKISNVDKVQDICVSKNYNLGLTKKNEAFFWGSFADDSEDAKGKQFNQKVIECRVGVKALKIACGGKSRLGVNYGSKSNFLGILFQWCFGIYY